MPLIVQPFNDRRLLVNGVSLECPTKEMADCIMAMQLQLGDTSKIPKAAAVSTPSIEPGLVQSALSVRERRLTAALDTIAFGYTDGLAGNPLVWPSTIAYLALGGRIEGGRHLDSRTATLEKPE